MEKKKLNNNKTPPRFPAGKSPAPGDRHVRLRSEIVDERDETRRRGIAVARLVRNNILLYITIHRNTYRSHGEFTCTSAHCSGVVQESRGLRVRGKIRYVITQR